MTKDLCVHHRFDVVVTSCDQHNTDGPTPREHALNETTGSERLVVRVRSDNDETLTGAHRKCTRLGNSGFGRCAHRRDRSNLERPHDPPIQAAS